MRDSTIIYRSFYEAIKELPEKNQCECWNALFEFALNFKEPELTGLSKTVFTLIRPQLEANHKRYKCGLTPKNKRKTSESKAKQKRVISETEANANDNDNDNDNGNHNHNGNKIQGHKPSLDEVRQYCTERKNGVDAVRWMNHYEAKGWMIGKNKMKDWKAAVRTWEKTTETVKPTKEYEGW